MRLISLLTCSVFVAACLAGLSNRASALDLDNFDGDYTIDATQINQTVYNTASMPGVVIGGFRTIAVTKTGGALKLTVDIFGGALAHSQAVGVVGRSLITYDGDNVSTPTTYTGLGGIDFTQDLNPGQPGELHLKVIGYDYPNSQALKITLIAYAATDASGLTYSSRQIVLNQSVTNNEFIIPYSDFTTNGPGGAVDFSNVGAVSVLVEGPPEADLSLDYLTTNGRCPLIPDSNGSVMNRCGDCRDVIEDCLGCDGVPYSGKIFDQCNVCGGDGTSCLGCDGVPFSGKVFDQCNVCAGDGTSCLGCDGVPFSAKVVDQCNVCGGDGKSCLGCDNIPFSNKQIDQCNVCGGDGKSCLDCKAQPFGTSSLDRCGVCDGDGQSCLQCAESDLRELLTALDGGAKHQERIIRQLLTLLSSTSKSKTTKAYIAKTRKVAHELQIRNWTIVWTVPRYANICVGNKATVFCATTSNQPVIDEYLIHNQELRTLTAEVATVVLQSNPKRKRVVERNLALAEQYYQGNIKMTAEVPAANFSCS